MLLGFVLVVLMAQTGPAYAPHARNVGVTLVDVADLDGDRSPEVLVLEHAPGGGGRTVRALRARDGVAVWSRSVREALSVSVGDVSGDKKPEVIAVSAPIVAEVSAAEVSVGASSQVALLTGSRGTPVWQSELELPRVVSTGRCLPPESWAGAIAARAYAVGDINGDRIRDVMVTFTAGTKYGLCLPRVDAFGWGSLAFAWLLSGTDGSPIRTILALGRTGRRGIPGLSWTFMMPVGDLLGRGQQFILEWGGDVVRARTMEGTVVWERLGADVSHVHQVELDGDRGVELLACTGTFVPPEHYGPLPDDCRGLALDGEDGSVIWDMAAREELQGRWLAGDLNGDGVDDVYTAEPSTRTLTARSGADLQPIWQHRSTPGLSTAVCCHDLDGDRRADFLYREAGSGVRGAAFWRARSARSGALMWSRPTRTDALALHPAHGDVDRRRGEDLLTASHPSGSRRVHLQLFSGSTGARLWSATVPAPSAEWSGTTRVVRASSTTSLLLVALRNHARESFARCRIHAVSAQGVVWSHPRC